MSPETAACLRLAAVLADTRTVSASASTTVSLGAAPPTDTAPAGAVPFTCMVTVTVDATTSVHTVRQRYRRSRGDSRRRRRYGI